ncbi:MAG: DUF1501 domain-containing protein [Thermoanaerobaculia bacterium]
MMKSDRRCFLKSTGLALVAGAFVPGVFVRMAHAGEAANGRVLVAVFLRGAIDGLNAVVPYGESAYYAARRSIAIPRPGTDGGALDLDGFFGLHPALEPLMPLWKNGSLAIVHAAGSPHASRSHFDAQDFMESGTPGVKATEDGFLARALESGGEATSPLRALSLTPQMPRILAGAPDAIAVADIAKFGLRAGPETAEVTSSFESMYGAAVAGALGAAGRDSFEAGRILRDAQRSAEGPANGARYPRGPLGNSLRQIAQLIRAGVGLEIAFTDLGGWDTHANQGGSQGQLAARLRELAAALSAFATDLGSRMDDVTLVTMSEFGRTVAENGTRGTDHGHATVMTLLGGGVKGRTVHGRWPGLDRDALFEGRDLAVTTDFRDVFAEVLTERMGIRDLSAVFPDHRIDGGRWPGVIA